MARMPLALPWQVTVHFGLSPDLHIGCATQPNIAARSRFDKGKVEVSATRELPYALSPLQTTTVAYVVERTAIIGLSSSRH